TGSQTDVGTSDNTYSITWDGTAKEANYSIDATIGKLTVKESENEIVVTTTGGTFTYDGEVHGAFVTVGTLPKGYMLETAESTASVMNVDDGEVTATADQLVIRNAKGEDVTSKLKITYNDGILKISPKDLNVTTTSSSKTYDGSAITAAGSYNGLVEGETIGFEVTGTQTNVGSSDNTYEITWKKTFGDATAVQSNYNVVENLGKLTVNAKAIDESMFTAPTDSVYDGGEHKFVPVLTYGEMTLADGTDYTVSYSTEDFTNAGVVTVTITGQGNYSGSVVKTYSITQAPLTIVTNNGTKVYDGEALTAAGEVQGLVEGETVDFTVTGSRTEVGTSQNTYSLEWTGSANVNNYSIAEEKIGNLTVTENADEIVVTTTGGEFTYDGASHGATVSVSTLPKGYYLETAASTASAINVADGTVTATADRLVIRNAKGEDVTDKLNISRINGSIKINPAALNVVTNGDEKVYDGTALTAGGSVSGYIGTETATFSTTGSQTAVGESTNSYSLVFDQSAIESNYTVSTDLGTLKVKEYAGEITVTTTGGEFTYDGQAHGATVSVSALPAGYTLDTATSSASVTDVNETAATATCDTLVILNAQGEDVTAKLNIRKTDGSIKVNKAVLTVVTPGGEKVYDGEALTSEGSISGFVNYETATFETTGSQTDVGTSDNTYEIVWDGTAKEANYSVEATVGKLTVKESEDEIVVTTTGGEFTYDGQAHGATVSVGALPKGYTLETAASTASVKDVDDGEITATADQLVIRNKKGEDVTSKLKITYLDDNIKITPKTLSVITNPASKTYDGSALTAGGTYSGLVEGETIGFEVTGTQTNVGTSNNTYSITWKTLFGDATAVQSNYSVSESVGTLTVNAKAIDETMFEAPADTVYDGSEHRFVPVITYGEMALAGGTDYTVSYSTQDFTNAGVITVAITGKGNYSGSVVKNYSITKAPLTIVTDTASKVYNGTALTAGGRVNGLVNNETVSFRVTGTQTEVGSSDNSYVIEFNSTAKADNYEITSITVGKLTVRENADEIVVTTTGGEFTYDGQAHGAIVSVSTLPAGYTLETATSDASATDVYEGKVIAGCDNLVIRNAAGTDVTDRLNITYVDGSITILPKTVTVAADPASKTYGDDDPELTAQTEGLLGSDEVIFTVDRASGENAGVYDITPAGDELQGNYRLSFVSGIFTINPKAALVKANDMSKDYGDADPELTATVSGTINGETVNYKLERAEGEVVGDYDITASGDEAQGNYAVSFEGGKFTIKPASSLKITAESYEASYDGKAHGSAAEVNVPDGTAITYSVDGGTSWSNENPTIKNVGEINVLVKAENSNYQTATAEYTLKVNKRQVTLTSPGGSKVYDGQPLPDGTIEIGGEGFAEGEGFAYQFTADRVNVGSRKDTFEYRIIQLKDENAIVKTLDSTFGKTEFEDADENNYEITTVFGDIVITEPPTPIPPVNPPVNPIDAAFNNGNGYTITNVTDGETPLADIAIDSCCIMHFSLLIVALLLLLGNEMATRDRRRKVRELEARLK
ncbi:MAG: MBG-2 domain-containing protein, partial [Mogibacterium sp.]|nr:MBG-2 domain-containing protein [Mogibacterium sp.]